MNVLTMPKLSSSRWEIDMHPKRFQMKSWLSEELRARAKGPTDIEALAAAELDRLRAERDHWRDLVPATDRAMFPFRKDGSR